MIVMGLDPSLTCTGWGVVRVEGARLSHIANGQLPTDSKLPIAERLLAIQQGVSAAIADHRPHMAAVEEVFVNKNPQSTLKLAHARGCVLAACAAHGVTVFEHSTRIVKKAVVGTGAAQKEQVQAMLKVLLPGASIAGPDAADALAVAIAHAHLKPHERR
ncbi:crossover junction endodeoxyribonuclease RuvC [Croceicoccus sp. F390]|uniref:Crossover junction endodeoxyribonuclease RuvC n=1 Tax=Croceicoccus esteveae TaxID=3075597 RepID=A0ABU2ZDE1_9SPHN|nr:crossover junction endodeoxyribonuclease RuvC [Croceicoccus sp. F390]MDT0574616.1 crossover junction endodeoxyribonuclease RuvC [Croceicoccus sp. F390]